ncbi:MAG: LacI family transcriptional regulator [Firmicutes bacterium]|nr:LacI family transcriptional regulator [Bacillota bacterium]
MAVTIKDVARIADVSPSTVSRVIAGHPRISVATQQKVRKAMRELGYHPNEIARSLVTRTTNTLGLVIPYAAENAFANPFFPEVLRGIGTVAQSAGFLMLLGAGSTEKEGRNLSLQMLRRRRVDGVILLGVRAGDQLIEDLLEEEHSFVVIGRVPDDRVAWVNNDNVAAARQVVEHLIHLGHRRIALVNGPDDFVVCQDRLEGYRQALAAHGMGFDPALVADGRFTESGGAEAAETLLKIPGGERPTAIFAIDDLMALGVVRAARAKNLRIPQDLAVAGFNDDPIAAHLEPALTTVRIPIFQMGAAAAGMLIGLVTRELDRPAQLILPAELVIRQSCGGR